MFRCPNLAQLANNLFAEQGKLILWVNWGNMDRLWIFPQLMWMVKLHT